MTRPTGTTREETGMSELTKVAMIRAAGYPVGIGAPVYLNCPCGARPATTGTGPDVVCSCGAVYTANGWAVAP
jgi:hypothetical protein